MRVSAWFSAAATASRIDSSASSMLVIVPDLDALRLRASAAPRTFRLPGSARPIRQITLDEPISRIVTRPVRKAGGSALRRPHADRLAHQVAFPRATGCLSPFFNTKKRLSRCAQINLRDIALKHAFVHDQMFKNVELLLPNRLPGAERRLRLQE